MAAWASCSVGHLDQPEPARLARPRLDLDLRRTDRAERLEQGPQHVRGDRVVQVADVNPHGGLRSSGGNDGARRTPRARAGPAPVDLPIGRRRSENTTAPAPDPAAPRGRAGLGRTQGRHRADAAGRRSPRRPGTVRRPQGLPFLPQTALGCQRQPAPARSGRPGRRADRRPAGSSTRRRRIERAVEAASGEASRRTTSEMPRPPERPGDGNRWCGRITSAGPAACPAGRPCRGRGVALRRALPGPGHSPAGRPCRGPGHSPAGPTCRGRGVALRGTLAGGRGVTLRGALAGGRGVTLRRRLARGRRPTWRRPCPGPAACPAAERLPGRGVPAACPCPGPGRSPAACPCPGPGGLGVGRRREHHERRRDDPAQPTTLHHGCGLLS